MTSYALGEDLVVRYDIDLVGDLATDDRATLDRDTDDTNITTHPNVLEALEDASSEVDAALMVGGRYTADQLTGLTGNAQKHLIRITCAIAIAGLFDRRPEAGNEKYRERVYDRAKSLLKSLKSGDNIFGLPENIAASVIDTDGPTVIETENRNDLTYRMDAYFPSSGSRLPRGRGN